MTKFSKFFLSIGTFKTVLLVTVASVLLSVLFTFLISRIFSEFSKTDMTTNLLFGALVPLFVAPIVSTGLIKLLFKVDALEKETRYLATYDVLTGLYTRRAFYEHADHQFKIAQRENQNLAILVVDVDEFKVINDTFGHQAGDMALKHISNIIKETVRISDFSGRLGGDEFIFCLPNAMHNEVLMFGKRLVECVDNASFTYDGNFIKLSISAGISSTEFQSFNGVEALIKMADQAMYRAKKSGKNQLLL